MASRSLVTEAARVRLVAAFVLFQESLWRRTSLLVLPSAEPRFAGADKSNCTSDRARRRGNLCHPSSKRWAGLPAGLDCEREIPPVWSMRPCPEIPRPPATHVRERLVPR